MPFELRIHDPTAGPQEVGSLEGIRVRILLMVGFIYPKGEDKVASEVRVELTSENDLFFHYSHILNEERFKAMQEA